MSQGSHDHAGHRSRQRARFRANGLNGFAPHEVLELILGYAIPRRDVNPLAHKLLKHFGTLHNVFDAQVDDLLRVEGIGEYAAVMLALFSAVSTKCEESRAAHKVSLATWQEAAEHCVRLLRGCKEEHLYAVYLNGQSEVLANVLISRGSLGEVKSYPRVVMDHALRYNAHAVILCHNHPGGSSTPSAADIGSTLQLRDVLDAVEVRLIDHFIVAGNEALSMTKEGFMEPKGLGVAAFNRAANSAGEVTIRHRMRENLQAFTEEE